jgi:hypothetical protein
VDGLRFAAGVEPIDRVGHQRDARAVLASLQFRPRQAVREVDLALGGDGAGIEFLGQLE